MLRNSSPLFVAGPVVEDDQRLGDAGRGHARLVGLADRVAEELGLRFVEEDGDDRGGVDDHHLGRPCSS
jgi:hypothetical protein